MILGRDGLRGLVLTCGAGFCGRILLGLASAEPAATEGGGVSGAKELSIEWDKTPLVQEGTPVLSYASALRKVRPAVVAITNIPIRKEEEPEKPPRGSVQKYLRITPPEEHEHESSPPRVNGTGVVITSDGFVMTNNHVIHPDAEVMVSFGKEKKKHKASVVGVDRHTDLALIKIEGMSGLTHAVLGDSEALEVGDVVLAVGNPYGLLQTATQGIVSALGRDEIGGASARYQNFIQTDAAINPGNSGGPLIDARGRVVGINTAINPQAGPGGGIGFAIPIKRAAKVCADLLERGTPVRGYLGVRLEDLDDFRREELGIPADMHGVVVLTVVLDGPAAKAGFRPGDLVTAIGDDKIESLARLRDAVAWSGPGDEVAFSVFRKGKNLTMRATLTEFPAEPKRGGGE